MNADVRDLYLAYLVAYYTLARSADYFVERYADDDEGRWITIGGRPEGDKKHVGGTHVKIDNEGRIIDGPEEFKGKRLSELSEKTELDEESELREEPEFSEESELAEEPELSEESEGDEEETLKDGQPGVFGPLAQEKIYKLGYYHTIYRGLRRRAIPVKNIFGEYVKQPTLDMQEAGYAFFTDDIAYAERFADPEEPRYIEATLEPHAVVLDLANVPDYVDGEYLDSIIPGLAKAMGYSRPDEWIEADALWAKPDVNVKPLADFVRQYGIDVIMWQERESWTFIVVNPEAIDIQGIKRFDRDEDDEEEEDEEEEQ
jgi:hypothetical protein